MFYGEWCCDDIFLIRCSCIGKSLYEFKKWHFLVNWWICSALKWINLVSWYLHELDIDDSWEDRLWISYCGPNQYITVIFILQNVIFLYNTCSFYCKYYFACIYWILLLQKNVWKIPVRKYNYYIIIISHACMLFFSKSCFIIK